MPARPSRRPYTPKHLHRWSRAPNYVGEDWSDWYIAPRTTHRDADDAKIFAFNRQLRAIPRALFDTPDGSSSPCIVTDSHWAVGWVRWYAIHKDDAVALRKADAMAARHAKWLVAEAVSEDCSC